MDTKLEQTDDRRARGNAVRLAAAQALAGANSSVFYATGGIIGASLAPNVSMATAPLSALVLGTALGALPTGWLARRFGRRVAFITGSGCGCLAGLLAMAAVLSGVFWAFCAAALLAGFYQSTVASFRFAAADGASAAFRPRAVSWVMVGGVFAGFFGPQLVNWTMGLWATYLFAASYLAQAVVALVAMAVLAGVNLPRPVQGEVERGRKLGEIVRQKRFIIAVICGIVSYGLMNMVMTSAPLAMHMCGLPVTASNDSIQWHIVAMYGPSFFTGSLIARFGAVRIAMVGMLLLAGAGVVGLSGITVAHFTAEMMLLGVGWNFGFVGASTMVLETHRPEERTRVQSFNDFLIFGTMAVGSASSGQILALHGWSAVNWIVFPPVAVGLVALAAAGLRRRGVTRTA